MAIKSIESRLRLPNYTLREILRSLLLPRFCVIHQDPATANYSRLCSKCLIDLRLFHQACLFCAKPHINGQICQLCQRNSAINNSHSLIRLNDLGRKILWNSKFYGNIEYLDDLLVLQKDIIDKWINFYMSRGYIFIFVPEAGDSLRLRGYHHNQYLRRYLQRRYGLKFDNVLLMAKHVRQTGRSRLYRMNMHSEVRLLKPLISDKVIVIDDVLTTGQTLNTIAKVLRKNGVKYVTGISIFRK